MSEVRWTRRVRSVMASVANVTGDWFYYFYLVDTEVPDIDNDYLLTIFLAICLASSFFSGLSILVRGFGCNRRMGCKKVCGITATHWVAFLEVALEDIPQVAVTALVSYRLGGPLSSQAVFNLTTSCMNLFLDVLDIFDEFHDDRQEALLNGNPAAVGGNYVSAY